MRYHEIIAEHIAKVEGGYRLLSHKGKNLGTFPTKSGAEKHEREVQYFKHMEEGEVVSMATRKVVTPRTDSMLGTFGGVLETLKQMGISMAEKPDYIDSDLLSDATNIDELSLRRLQKTVGKLPVYKVNDIYPKKKDYTDYLQSKIENLPQEELFIVDFSEVNHGTLPSRYLVRRSANSLRWWAPVI